MGPFAWYSIGKMKSLLRVLKYLKPYRHLALVTLCFAVTTTLIDLAPPWVIKKIVDAVVRGSAFTAIAPFLGLIFLAYAGRNIANSLRIRFNNHLEQKVIFDMRQEIFGKLQRLPLSYFDNMSTGEIQSRINDDVTSVERVFIDGVEQFTVASLMLVGVTTCLLLLNWRLALLAMAPIPFLVVGAVIYTKSVHQFYRVIRQKLAQMNAFVQDRISGIRLVKAFTKEASEQEAFGKKNQEYCKSNLMVVRAWSLFTPSMAFAASMGTFLILIFGSRQVLAHRMSVGEWIAFVSYLALFYQPINQIHALNHMMQHAIAAGRRIFEIMDFPQEGAEYASSETEHVPDFPKNEPILAFENVSFPYKDKLDVLKDVSFQVREKEKIALVGLTGAGKTTVFSLILRFYSGWEGAIRFRGQDIGQMPLNVLRSQFAMVFQEPFLFNGTIRENILYGAPDATEEQMTQAAMAARAHDFISKLPKGYDSWVGERGVKLSVGEKQRVTIARAILCNPTVILLDEATSNLDSQTESAIQEALEQLMKDKTVLIIAHRLATVMHADRILVLHEGSIRAAGPHAELYEKDALYRSLIENHFRYSKTLEVSVRP